MARHDVVIVGGGIIGTAIFESLTGAGMDCLLVEGLRVGLGATGYSGAMVRLAHPDPVAISAAGIGLVRYTQFKDETDGRVQLTRCGHLYFAEEAVLASILPRVRAFSPAADILDRAEIAEHFPGMVVTAQAALYEPDAGFADPVVFAKHQAALGIANGGILAEATKLDRLILSDGAVVGVETSQGPVDCGAVVLATGAASPDILKRHDLEEAGLWSQKIHVTQFLLVDDAQHWAGFVDDSLGLNGLPGQGRGSYYFGLPVGRRSLSAVQTSLADPVHSAQTSKTASQRFPAAIKAQAQGAMCHADCYSDRPIAYIGPLNDGPDGLCLATGFSGGGFKMAPYAAQRVAEFLT